MARRGPACALVGGQVAVSASDRDSPASARPIGHVALGRPLRWITRRPGARRHREGGTRGLRDRPGQCRNRPRPSGSSSDQRGRVHGGWRLSGPVHRRCYSRCCFAPVVTSGDPVLSVGPPILKVHLITRCPHRAASRSVRRRSAWLIVVRALVRARMCLRLAEARSHVVATTTARGARSAAMRASHVRSAALPARRASSYCRERCVARRERDRGPRQCPDHFFSRTGEINLKRKKGKETT
jgi:hypothetical protein